MTSSFLRRLWNLLILSGAMLGLPFASLGQFDDYDTRVPVSFFAAVKAPSNLPIGETTWFSGYLNNVEIEVEMLARNATYYTPIETTDLVLGVDYTISTYWDGALAGGYNWVNANFTLSAPPGHVLYFDGVARRSILLAPNQLATVSVRRISDSPERLPTVGRLIWQVPVGNCCDGTGGGMLEIRQGALSAAVYSPSALRYVGEAWYDVESVYSGGVIRQVKLPSKLVDIVSVTDGYEIRFYASGDYGTSKVSGVYPINGGATPFTKHCVKNAVPANGKTLRITQTTGTEDDVVELFFDSSTQEWKRTIFNAGTAQSVLRQTQIQTSPRIVELTVAPAAAPTNYVTRTRAIYETIAGLELLSQLVRDFNGKNYTSDNAYYSDSTNRGSYLKRKWQKGSDGNWTKWDYYEVATEEHRFGQVKQVYRPFKDSPAGPENASATQGTVTTFDYFSSTDSALKGLPASKETRIDNVLVGKSTYDYATGTAGGKTVVTKTTKDFHGTGTSDYVQSVDKYFPETLAGTYAFYRNKPHSTTDPAGQRTAYLHQRGNWSGGAFTAGTGDYSRVVKLIGTASNVGGSARLVQYWESTATANQVEDIYLYAGQSMATMEIRNPAGNVIRSEERVLKSGTSGTTAALSDFEVVAQTDAIFDNLDHLLTKTTLRGTEYTATYLNGRLRDETDLSGAKVEYTREDFDQLVSSKKLGVNNAYSVQGDLTTSYTYDAAGRTLTTTVSGGGTEQLTSTTAYDLAGEVTQSTDANGTVRTHAWENSGAGTPYTTERVRTLLGAGETYADGTSTYSEIVTTKHRDGRTKDVTGSGTVPTYYEYSVPQAGQLKTKTLSSSATSPRYAETVVDMLGRNVSTTTPKYPSGVLTATQVYTAGTGLLEKTVTPGLGDQYYFYDQFGRLKRQGLDADATAGLQDASASDRITEYDSRFVKDGTDWWLQMQTFGFPEPSSGTKVLLGRSRQRLTGFPEQVNSGVTNRLVGETYVWGINPNPATLESALTGRAEHSLIRRFPATLRVETYSDSPDATADGLSRTVNGLAVMTISAAGAQTTTAYDALLRVSQVDQATGNSDGNLGPATVSQQFEYFTGKTRLKQQKEKNAAGTWITSVEQDFYGDGLVKWSKNPEGRYTRQDYNPRGQMIHRWGDGVTPEQNYYNGYGELQYLYTYRGGTGWDTSSLPGAFSSSASDAASWVRDAATGLLIQKTDAANKTESWGFDAYNRTTSHTSARAITTTIALDPKTGEVTGKTYSDNTPALSFTYNRLGLTQSVTDVTGTRTLTYRTATDYQLEDETLNASFYGTDLHLRTRFNGSIASARPEGYTLGVATSSSAAFSSTHLDVTYGFDTANARLTSLQANTRNAAKNHTFTFGYLGNTEMLRQIDGPQSTIWKRAYEPYRAVLKTSSIERGNTTYARYQHVRDDLSRVTQETQDGQLFADYGNSTPKNLTITYTYDTRGQLATADTKVNNNSVSLTERYFGATYDNAANRATENRYSTSTSTSYRETFAANALNQYTNKTVRTAVEVGGTQSAGGTITVTFNGNTYNATQPGSGKYWRAELARYGATDSPVLGSVYNGGYFQGYAPFDQRQTSESLTWDNSGNLVNTAKYTLTYDAEDRLIELRDKADTDIRKVIAYDYQGRRVEEMDYNYAGTLSRHRRFVWAGWALLAEVDVNVSTQAKTVRRTFVWGPDLSSSVHGVAGIGGLLLIDKSTTQQWVVGSDGRGNVTTMLDALATDTGTPANNLKAGVEYTPYGEVVRAQGSIAELPFRFQSKWALGQAWDGQWSVELLDFGRRAYAPSLGRFISRDPAGEAAGANLYHYCGNDPINRMDPLGLIEKKSGDRVHQMGACTGTMLPPPCGRYGLQVATIQVAPTYSSGPGGQQKDQSQLLRDRMESAARSAGIVLDALKDIPGELTPESIARINAYAYFFATVNPVGEYTGQSAEISLGLVPVGGLLAVSAPKSGSPSLLARVGSMVSRVVSWVGEAVGSGFRIVGGVGAFLTIGTDISMPDLHSLEYRNVDLATGRFLDDGQFVNFKGEICGRDGFPIPDQLNPFNPINKVSDFEPLSLAAKSGIGATGKIGEDALKALGGESQVYFRTTQGGRYVDQLVNGIANESKVGYQSLTPTISRQIGKDVELINSGQINGSTWHFFQSPVTGVGGPSQPLLNTLQQNGINVIIHP